MMMKRIGDSRREPSVRRMIKSQITWMSYHTWLFLERVVDDLMTITLQQMQKKSNINTSETILPTLYNHNESDPLNIFGLYPSPNFLVGSANLHPRNQSSKSPQATLESSTLKPWHPTAAMALKPCRPGSCGTQPRPISCGESQVGVSKFVEVGVFEWRWATWSNWLVGVLLDLVCMNDSASSWCSVFHSLGFLEVLRLGSANVHKGNVGWTQGDFILNYRNW